MDVSIIIINYRTPQLIIDCLKSIYKFTTGVSFEIIVVDNDPEHGEGQLVRAEFPEIKWLDMAYNSGFGRANNKGMQVATARYFLILNADTLVSDNVIGRCVEHMDAQKNVIACGALQHDAQDKPMNFYKSFNEFRKTLFILPAGRAVTNLLDKIYPEPVYSDPNQHDWLVGAFMLVRKEGFEQTGGLDEDFFMYAEDVEWSSRLGKLGKLCYFKDCTFTHLENENPFRRTNISWINRFSTQMQVSNMLWVRKQYGLVSYLLLLLHYVTMVPVIFIWKLLLNLRTHQPLGELRTQRIFTRKTMVLLGYFWKTALLKPNLYKIRPEENIDLLTKS
jgi:GT2 family glycosyltransferase